MRARDLNIGPLYISVTFRQSAGLIGSRSVVLVVK